MQRRFKIEKVLLLLPWWSWVPTGRQCRLLSQRPGHALLLKNEARPVSEQGTDSTAVAGLVHRESSAGYSPRYDKW